MTRRYGGTGLGLSLVRQIVEAHGSMLDVQSTEGHGSTFKFPLLAAIEAK
jgi:signal transduction histidine kinase